MQYNPTCDFSDETMGCWRIVFLLEAGLLVFFKVPQQAIAGVQYLLLGHLRSLCWAHFVPLVHMEVVDCLLWTKTFEKVF